MMALELMVEEVMLVEVVVEEEVLEVTEEGEWWKRMSVLLLPLLRTFLRAFNETKGQIFLSSVLEV